MVRRHRSDKMEMAGFVKGCSNHKQDKSHCDHDARLASHRRLVPERRVSPTILVKPKDLDTQLLETPALALNNVRLELSHMGGYVKEMVAGLHPAVSNRAIDAVTHADENLASDVISMKENLRHVVDEIYQHQSRHLGEVGAEDIGTVRLEMELSERLQRLYTVARRLAKQVLPTEAALKAD
jgi:Na+/phosphate symporter